MLLCVVNVDFDITLINIVEFVQTPFGLRVRGEIAVCSPSLSNLFHTKDHAKEMRWQVFLKDYICCVCHEITATRLKSRYILSVLPSGVVSRWQRMLTIVNMSLLHFFFFALQTFLVTAIIMTCLCHIQQMLCSCTSVSHNSRGTGKVWKQNNITVFCLKIELFLGNQKKTVSCSAL